MEIKKEIVDAVKLFLDKEGIEFFRTCKISHGSFTPILMEQCGNTTIYHPVDFNQGVQIRHFLQTCGLCEDWEEKDFFQNWTMVVAAAIE